jgi:hypothetical protein
MDAQVRADADLVVKQFERPHSILQAMAVQAFMDVFYAQPWFDGALLSSPKIHASAMYIFRCPILDGPC